MSQILHIFKKDTRRLWIELLVSLVALGGLTYSEWWLCTPAADPRWYNQAAPIISLLLCWIYLVSRLVHGEVLVGDRQFWITRPYSWYKLLIAKFSFILVWLALPAILSACILLALFHFPIAPHLPPITESFFTLVLIVIMPGFAMATITRNFAQWFGCMLAVLLVIIGTAFLDSLVPASRVSTNTALDAIEAVSLAALVAIAITLQYARRERWLSGGLMALAAVLIPTVVFATPYASLIHSTYPDVAQMAFHLKFSPAEKKEPNSGPMMDGSKVSVNVPVEITDVPADTLLEVSGVSLRLDLPGEPPWSSGWQTSYAEVMQSRRDLVLEFKVDQKTYNRIKDTAVPAQVQVAFTEMRDGNRQRVIAQPSFNVKGIGQCWLATKSENVQCRGTSLGPGKVLVSLARNESTCGTPATDDDMGTVLRELNSNSMDDPLNPVGVRSFNFGEWTNEGRKPLVCPETPLTFSTPQISRRFTTTLSLGEVKLSDLAAPDFRRLIFTRP